MEVLNATEACFMVDDDLLDFTLENKGEEDEDRKNIFKGASTSSYSSSVMAAATAVFSRETGSGLFPELVEEELEWLSNKDAFPSVETCFGILSDNPELILNHRSPISVLETTTISSGGTTAASCSSFLKVLGNFPVRPRSKSMRRKRDQHQWMKQVNLKTNITLRSTIKSSRSSKGRRCLHCQAEKTPQWRAGPLGPKTLCNACGVRYKSGRLVPEYRPANSPTFSSELHSNSHRKVVEMRRQKYTGKWNYG